MIKQSRETNSIINDFEKTNNEKKIEFIQCNVCNSTIDVEETLREHLLKSHGVECKKCDKTY